MKHFLTIIALLVISMNFGQVAIKKSTVSSGGEISTHGNVTVISNLCEVAVQERNQGNIHISEGFISPEILQTTGVAGFSLIKNINVYPNPAVKYVNISMQEITNYEIVLTDINGKQLWSKTGDEQQIQIDLQYYQSGTYLLIVKDVENKQYKVFKLIKA